MILRQQAERVGYKRNFTILDNEDSKDLIDVVLKASKIDTKAKMFPKGGVLKGIFSYAVNTMSTIEDTIRERTPFFYDISEEIITLYNLYTEKKKAANAMDFDDLLFYWHKVLLENEDLRNIYATTFSQILVEANIRPK
jgi:DNA helicase-2/ATP-dependent DNA helicase PcrA